MQKENSWGIRCFDTQMLCGTFDLGTYQSVAYLQVRDRAPDFRWALTSRVPRFPALCSGYGKCMGCKHGFCRLSSKTCNSLASSLARSELIGKRTNQMSSITALPMSLHR